MNGNRENANNYLFDGVDNNTRLTLVIVMRPNVEAIKEFKVQTNLYSAEQGRNPGGQINVVTKSGSNAFAGVGTASAQRQPRREQLLRQSRRAAQAAVRAVSVRRRRRRSDRQEPHLLFADYDGFRQDVGRVFPTVPTEKMRRAISARSPPSTIRSRRRRSRAERSRQPFPGNVIPADRWDPVTAKLINAYPLPTGPGLANTS